MEANFPEVKRGRSRWLGYYFFAYFKLHKFSNRYTNVRIDDKLSVGKGQIAPYRIL